MTQRILITGASSGIGYELARLLAEKNCEVIVVARREEALKNLSKQYPNNIEYHVCDLGEPKQRAQLISHLQQQKLDAVVHDAASMAPVGPIAEIDYQTWREQVAINIEAPLFLTQSLLNELKGGRLLFVTIHASMNYVPDLGAYAITKAALNRLAEYYRQELKDYDIAVSNILPPVTETDIQKPLLANPKLAATQKFLELKKAGKLASANSVAKQIIPLLLEIDRETLASQALWELKV